MTFHYQNVSPAKSKSPIDRVIINNTCMVLHSRFDIYNLSDYAAFAVNYMTIYSLKKKRIKQYFGVFDIES